MHLAPWNHFTFKSRCCFNLNCSVCWCNPIFFIPLVLNVSLWMFSFHFNFLSLIFELLFQEKANRSTTIDDFSNFHMLSKASTIFFSVRACKIFILETAKEKILIYHSLRTVCCRKSKQVLSKQKFALKNEKRSFSQRLKWAESR